MNNGFSKYWLRNMWVKQGCVLSPAPSSLCTDKLEEIVNNTSKGEGLDDPKLIEEIIIIPLNLNDVLLFLDTTKAIQRRHYTTFRYKGEPTQVAQSFKYLGIYVPPTNRWNTCYNYKLQLSWNSYYMLKSQCNQSNPRG